MDYKKIVDWFLDKGRQSQVIIILLLFVSYLGYNYYKNQQEVINNVDFLETRVIQQDSTITSLRDELRTARFENILTKANEDTSPVPMFLINVETGVCLWVNKAYEEKYLLPKFTNRDEFIGTTGEYVFGEENVKIFHENNRMVFKQGRPITFTDEINTTLTKFPVKVGDYIYAIGGIEYINFK